MLYIALLIFAVLASAYFAFRYFSLTYAIKKLQKDIDNIQQDLTQNQMLHLPVPNRHLKNLLCSFNSTLEEIQKERLSYEQRERNFQKQIENISHDLRTPLTVILGYLKLYKKTQEEQISKNPELSETINMIEQKAEVIKRLVTQFYDFSRVTADDYELTLTPIDISRFLREFIMENYQILEQENLQIKIDIPKHPVWLLAESSALERIFLNLFQNAGRYASSFFRVMLKEEAEKVSILFRNDTDIISKDDIPHLFERFYTPDKSRNQGGTGLGLTIAKSLAEEMNGTLHAEAFSEDKTIICFYLEFPNIS